MTFAVVLFIGQSLQQEKPLHGAGRGCRLLSSGLFSLHRF